MSLDKEHDCFMPLCITEANSTSTLPVYVPKAARSLTKAPESHYFTSQILEYAALHVKVVFYE